MSTRAERSFAKSSSKRPASAFVRSEIIKSPFPASASTKHTRVKHKDVYYRCHISKCGCLSTKLKDLSKHWKDSEYDDVHQGQTYSHWKPHKFKKDSESEKHIEYYQDGMDGPRKKWEACNPNERMEDPHHDEDVEYEQIDDDETSDYEDDSALDHAVGTPSKIKQRRSRAYVGGFTTKSFRGYEDPDDELGDSPKDYQILVSDQPLHPPTSVSRGENADTAPITSTDPTTDMIEEPAQTKVEQDKTKLEGEANGQALPATGNAVVQANSNDANVIDEDLPNFKAGTERGMRRGYEKAMRDLQPTIEGRIAAAVKEMERGNDELRRCVRTAQAALSFDESPKRKKAGSGRI